MPESGEDSEDEWNYIKVQKESTIESAEPTSLDSVQPQEHEEPVIQIEQNQFQETEYIERVEPIAQIEQHQLQETERIDHIESETSTKVFESIDNIESDPSASVFELHAVAQALAETHEELLLQDDQQIEEEHQDTLEPELLQLEAEAAATIDEAASFQAASKSALLTDIEGDEDMDSLLNPDAKEFVPVSPQRTPTTSPFGNGGNQLRRPELQLEDDRVLAQSPRKGGSPITDLVIPAEMEFDSEISNRPQEIVDEINTSLTVEETTVAVAPTTTATAQNGSERPGSSSSQYSYQEMNLKEAMHGDEKQEYAPDDTIVSPGVAPIDDLSAATDPLSDAINESNGLAANRVNDKFLRESDPMSMSFYNDGSSDTGNPFAVDMNAVQMLPVDDDDDEEDEQKHASLETPYHFEGHEGQHFVIQDTEFGMNGRHESPIQDEVSKPEEDQYTPVDNETKSFLSHQEISAPFESDQPEADLQSSQPSSIIQVVQELATEATSLLNHPSSARLLQFDNVEVPQQHIANSEGSFKDYEENVSDVTATPTDEVPAEIKTPFEELAEAEQNYSQMESTPEPERVEAVEELIVKTVAKRAAEEPTTDEVALENVQLLVDNTLSKMVGGQVVSEESEVKPEEALPVEVVTQVDDAASGVVDKAKERLTSTGSAVPTVEVPIKSTTTTTSTTKKPDSKATSKTSTTSTTAAKKPSAVASSRSVTTTTTAAKPTTARPAVGSSPTSRPRSVPSSTAKPAAPSAKSTVPIKPTTASTLTAKKPVPNGDAKSTLQSKKLTTAAPSKSLSATTSTAAAKTLAAKPTPRAPISSRPPAPSAAKTSSSLTSAASKPASSTVAKTTTSAPRYVIQNDYNNVHFFLSIILNCSTFCQFF